jgi:superfamily I DNA/RNA helicase
MYNIAARKRIYANTVLVDEVQDTSPYQFHLLNQLYGRDVRIIVVGDRLQAIYAFRGSYADSMDRVGNHIEARELPLSVTYRCCDEIVKFTNENIMGSEMIPHKDGGEVEFIAKDVFVDQIKEHRVPMIIGAKNKSLIRAWLELAKFKIASTLKDKGITREIRRILEDYKVIPTNGEPPEISIAELIVAIDDTIKNSYVIDEDGESQQTLPVSTVDMYECIKEIIQIHGISHYTDFLNLLDEMDKDSDHELHTVHSSKGLEADSVIVLGDWFKNDQLTNMQYVAYTRAKNRLMIVTDWEREEDVVSISVASSNEDELGSIEEPLPDHLQPIPFPELVEEDLEAPF